MFKTFLSELRRRNVLPTVVPYVGLIWLVLQVISVIQPMLNLSPLVGTFTAITLFALFPVVLYLSWYFNFTLHGLEPIGDAESGEISKFGAGKWLVILVIMSGSGGMGYLYYGEVKEELVKRKEGTVQIANVTSIAVLPFRDQSPDQDQSFITKGITEELTALLGKSSNLKVAAASSAFALMDQNLTPMDIGRRLQVDTLVTGSLRVTGNQLKIRTELIDSKSGMTLWTESFSREFKDIFAVEEEIGRSIVNLLEDRYLEKGQITSAAKTATTDAYIMYLKGREQYRIQTTESIKTARDFFEQAIALDPEYVSAYVALADTIILLEKGQSRFGVLDTDIAIALADQQLAKAFVRDQTNARAYAIQGKLFELKQDFDAAISSLDKAISINPSLAVAHMWRFTVTRQASRHSEALESIKKAVELDPISITNLYNLGLAYSLRGKFELAEELFQRLNREFPESPIGYSGLANNYYLQGQLSESAQQWQSAYNLSSDNQNYLYGFLDTLIALRMPEKVRSLTDDPSFEPSLLIFEEKFDALFKMMDFQLKANPEDPWLMFEAGWYELLYGNSERGTELLLQSYGYFSQEDLFAMPMCSPGIEIAWALQTTDKLDEATKMIDRCSAQQKIAEESDISDSFVDHLGARIAALKANYPMTEQMLDKAFKNGWREWWTSKDPILREVQDSPELNSLFEKIDSELRSEKQKLEQFFANSEADQTN